MDIYTHKVAIPNSKKALTMNLRMSTPSQVTKQVGTLIDTGAEMNLIKRGLFPTSDFRPARNPTNFVAANVSILEGGDRQIVLEFAFRQVRDGKEIDRPLRCIATFYEADIQVDAIIGFPWLHRTQIGIFPHHNALAQEKPFTLLLGNDLVWKRRVQNPKKFEEGDTPEGDQEEIEVCKITTKKMKRRQRHRRRVENARAEIERSGLRKKLWHALRTVTARGDSAPHDQAESSSASTPTSSRPLPKPRP